jgi:sugar phosphate isomerase/epimerase
MSKYKLSISNIAWPSVYDNEIYLFLQEQSFDGLEIAPTKIFSEKPYERLDEAKNFAKKLKDLYGLSISSMQSIWYGKKECIFGTNEERRALVDYTKKAVNFAVALSCENIVFGCPKNRVLPSDKEENHKIYLSIAHDFFIEIAEYAAKRGVVIALEPNPPYYGTNFINTTPDAFAFCEMIHCDGLKVNVDLGTCINYGESIDFLNLYIHLVNHIHISEPMLAPIEERAMFRELKKLDYNGFFSIEMANSGNIEIIKRSVGYIKDIFFTYSG